MFCLGSKDGDYKFKNKQSYSYIIVYQYDPLLLKTLSSNFLLILFPWDLWKNRDHFYKLNFV